MNFVFLHISCNTNAKKEPMTFVKCWKSVKEYNLYYHDIVGLLVISVRLHQNDKSLHAR